MPLMPGAEYVGPIPDTNYANSGPAKIGVAGHVIVGSAASALGEFRSPGAQLSAHFIVCGPGDQWPDGHKLQVLDTSFCCYAQAAGNYPPTAYIAVEFAGTPDQPMSAAQVASGADIIRWSAPVHNFPIVGPVEHGQPGVTPHCHPNGQADPAWGNHSCPGTIRLAQFPSMIAAAHGGPVPPVPSAPKFPSELFAMLASDPGFAVRFIYRFALHREVDAAGFTANVNWLNAGGDLNTVLANLQDSGEGQAVIKAERKLLGI